MYIILQIQWPQRNSEHWGGGIWDNPYSAISGMGAAGKKPASLSLLRGKGLTAAAATTTTTTIILKYCQVQYLGFKGLYFSSDDLCPLPIPGSFSSAVQIPK